MNVRGSRLKRFVKRTIEDRGQALPAKVAKITVFMASGTMDYFSILNNTIALLCSVFLEENTRVTTP